MKNSVIFFVALCFIVLYSCGNQPPINQLPKVKSDREELGLKGDVKILRQEEYFSGNFSGQIGVRTSENSFSMEFNNRGEKIGEVTYDSIGGIFSTSNYKFSNQGLKLEKSVVDIEGRVIKKCSYDYDSYGRIIKFNISEPLKGFDYYTVSEYDNMGNEVKSTIFDPSGQKVETGEYTYQNGNNVKLILKDFLDTPIAISEYGYNMNGDIIKEVYYTGNNLKFEEYSYEYTYDYNNNWIKMIKKLDAKYMNTSSNENRRIGVQTITLRTLVYN
jgi:hypothetical protein